MLKLQSEKETFAINLPTSLKEITPEILTALCDGISIPPYHAIVALCHSVKLITIAINVNNDKEQAVSVVPLIAKANKEDLDKVNGAIGNRIIVDRSSIERGVHIVIPTMISSKNVSAYIKGDEILRKKLLNGSDGSNDGAGYIDSKSAKQREEMKEQISPVVHVLEFKVIAINDISAFIPNGFKLIDPFKVTSKELVS